MAAVNWTRYGSPAEVTWARATGAAALIAVGTAGGHLHLCRRSGPSWQWERLGAPPGAAKVIDAALLAASGGPDALTPAVVGDDLRVWLHRPDVPWTGLSGPSPDEGRPRVPDCGHIVATHDAESRHALVVSSATGRAWIRRGIDPDAAWLPTATDADWIAVEFATAPASVADGTEPQQHVFSLTASRALFSVPVLRVAVREGSGLNWFEPDGPPSVDQLRALSATGLRDGDGRFRACAAVIATNADTFADNAMVLIGSGRDWRWADLGRPPVEGALSTAVVAVKGPDPRTGDEPVIIGCADRNIWTRTLTGDWTDLGPPPEDTALVSPSSAFEVSADDAARRVWATGVSLDSELWTFESDDAGVRWERHGRPSSVNSVVGAYSISRDVLSGTAIVQVIDEVGAMWSCELRGKPADTLFSSGNWTSHGTPAADVTAAAGIGTFTLGGMDPQPAWSFVVGSDGHLWARTTAGTGWTWVDHGTPPDTSVKAGVGPISAELPGGQPTVYVLADDGRLWMRSAGGDAPAWTDLGMPQGQLIFALVGAASPPSPAGLLPAVVVVTGDGHLWINDSDGGTSTWIDLGTPTPAERIVAGIGVEVMADVEHDSTALDIAVLAGSPSGQVWSNRWVRGRPSRWTAHGRPADARVRAAIGTMPDPANAAGCLIAVIGNDKQIWVAASAVSGGWTRWDPASATTTIAGGRGMDLLDMSCAVVLDDARRLTIAKPMQD
ncbi:hypothetical protein [Actinomadura sp. 3N407]|uniref:hypothetical protein n=1 Tax=Actinomadura sp. 3N407 TaxID=3457423 RepID=UPI003FCD1723